MARRRLVLVIPGLVGALATASLCHCSGSEACAPHAQTYCHDDAAYWVNGCKIIEGFKETCPCGCAMDHTGCLACACTCSTVDDCCNGCLAQHEGEVCDDGDPGTITDICVQGTCSGWNPASIAVPAAPAPPDPVQLQSWPCPDRWDRVQHATVLDAVGAPFSWCQPPPLPRLKAGSYLTPLAANEQPGERAICEPEVDGNFPLLGYPTCQPLGDPCPAAAWPEVPPETPGNRIFVALGATGGNGSVAAPFGYIADAVSAAVPGDVVIIGAGTFTESVTISKPLTLWGKCIVETAIDAPGPYAGPGTGAVVVDGSGEVVLRNLRISGAQIGVRVKSAGAVVKIQSVWIHQSTQQGIFLDAGEVQLAGSLVDLTHSDDTKSYGRAMTVETGARIQVESSTFEGNHESGVLVGFQVPQASFTDTVVRNTLPEDARQMGGAGMVFTQEVTASLTRILLDGNRGVGLIGLDPGAFVTADGVLIQETKAEENTLSGGHGVESVSGAHLTLSHGLLEGNHDAGILVSDPGSRLILQDTVILGTHSAEDTHTSGLGIWVQLGAELSAARILLEGNREAGLQASTQATSVSLSDGIVLHTLGVELDQSRGSGVVVTDGAQMKLNRVRLDGNHLVGALASEAGSSLTLEDVVVRDTQSQESDQMFGRGLNVFSMAAAVCRRVLLEGNTETGILVSDTGSTLTLEDVTIRGTRGESTDGAGGIGLVLTSGAQASLERGLLEANHAVGCQVMNPGTLLSLRDLTIRNTLSQSSNAHFGRGLEVDGGAEVQLQRGWLEGNRDVGVFLDGASSTGSFEDLTVRNTMGRDADLRFGRGLNAQHGAKATVVRGQFIENRDMGVLGLEDGSFLSLEQVVIRSTEPEACAALDPGETKYCAQLGTGTALGVINQAEGKVRQLEAGESKMAGLQLANFGSFEGVGLWIHENPVGINIQNAPVGFDFFDAVVGLQMSDNATNFNSEALPVPDPTEEAK